MHDIYIAFTSVVVCFADTCTHSVPIFVVFIIANFVPSIWPIAVGIAGAVAFVIAVVIIVPVSHICIFLLFHIFSCFYIPYDFDSDLIYTETSAVTKAIVVLGPVV